MHSHNLPCARYRLEPGSAGAGAFFRAYDRHFTELALAQRFHRASTEFLRSQANILRHVRDRSVDQLRTRVRAYAQDEAEALGANHWKVATLRAVADSDEFLRYAREARR